MMDVVSSSQDLGADRFRLEKWYFDCVTKDGNCVILYRSRLAWKRLAMSWTGTAVWSPGAEPRFSASLARNEPPAVSGDSLVWLAGDPGCQVRLSRRCDAVGAVLLDGPEGRVEWTCPFPAAQAQVRVRMRAFNGTGYGECILLTLPPWRLPIERLRWGRWMADDLSRCLVWIEWMGEVSDTWVFLDGRRVGAARVNDDSIVAGDVCLGLSKRRDLTGRSLSDILRSIAPLRAAVPDRIWKVKETKWLGEGVLADGVHVDCRGSAVFESVSFR